MRINKQIGLFYSRIVSELERGEQKVGHKDGLKLFIARRINCTAQLSSARAPYGAELSVVHISALLHTTLHRCTDKMRADAARQIPNEAPSSPLQRTVSFRH